MWGTRDTTRDDVDDADAVGGCGDLVCFFFHAIKPVVSFWYIMVWWWCGGGRV
jgi:hypothetical protein